MAFNQHGRHPQLYSANLLRIDVFYNNFSAFAVETICGADWYVWLLVIALAIPSS
jgi:hypothetical protein